MRKSKNRTSNNTLRAQRPPRTPERTCNTEGVYGNNNFMHAAVSNVGNVVKLETVQGAIFEGIFKTFSHNFEVVLELAHKVDNNDPKKFNTQQVVDFLIFQAKDIVHMCAQNVDPSFAAKDSFLTDANISNFNGEVTGEKELQPWEGPVCNGEEYDLDNSENNQNGWDVIDMFMANNKKFGVQSTYDDTLADYTCQLQRKDTKDFKDDEAKAARIAMEIEKNPTSHARILLENGENEEELYASVSRSGTENDSKYVPPAIRKQRTQHHRSNNNRGNYSANGNHCVFTASSHPSFNIVLNTNTPTKVSYSSSSHSTVPVYTSSSIMPIIPSRSVVRQGSNPLSSHNTYPPRDREPRINGQIMENHSKHHNRPSPLILRGTARGNQRTYVPESPGRQQMNNSATVPRYHNQSSQQYHQQTHGSHSQPIRENNRSSPENKNASICTSNVPSQSQNIPSYSANMHQRTYSQNVPVQPHPKSQRTSPVAVPTGSNSEYPSKQQLSSVSQQQTSHQYQQPQNGANVNSQRKHHNHHHHTRGREEQINELRKFGSDFNLSSYEAKSAASAVSVKDETPKQIQVVTSRNKSPVSERNIVPVTIIPTLPSSKSTSQNSIATQAQQQQAIIITTAQAISPTGQQALTVTQPPTNMAAAQVTIKQHAGPPPPIITQHQQQIHLHQRGDAQQILMHQPPHMQPQISQSTLQHHAQPQSIPQQSVITQKPPPPSHQQQQQQQAKSIPVLHQSPPSVLQTQSPQMQQHAITVAAVTTQNQAKPVMQTQSVQAVMPTNSSTNVTISNQQSQQQQQNCTLSNVTASQQQQQQPPQPQRPTLQQQQSIKSQNSQTTLSSSSSPPSEVNTSDADNAATDKNAANEHDDDDGLDDVTSAWKNSKLNPNAKEFVYNPTPKSFSTVSRSPSTPSQSRPHTPQTPSYNVHSANAAAATGLQMVMPATYVVAAPTAAYVPAAPPQSSRLRKVAVGPHRTDYHPSNMQVAAATGQPLLTPAVSIAQPALAPTQFAVQGYTHHHHLAAAAAAAAAAQPYQHVQMLRMVPQQGGGMVPLVPSTISYHDTSGGSSATAMYVNHGNGTASVAMTPHTPHVHHPQQHPPPSTAPSPSQTPQGPSQSHTPNSYQQPPLATQSAPPYQPIMCPVMQAPPPHGPPHHMVAAAPAQPHAMQQYLQHPQVAQQPHIVSLIPHSCS